MERVLKFVILFLFLLALLLLLIHPPFFSSFLVPLVSLLLSFARPLTSRPTITTITPNDKTPDDKRLYKLNWFDGTVDNTYTPLLMFYEAPAHPDVKMLKSSLSKTLSAFPTFAGRFEEGGYSIICDDQGVPFVEVTHKNKNVSDFLEGHQESLLMKLFSQDCVPWKEPWDTSAPIMAVQLNLFECGGAALGICLNHRAGDTATLSMFLKYWVEVASGTHQAERESLYEAASFFQQTCIPDDVHDNDNDEDDEDHSDEDDEDHSDEDDCSDKNKKWKSKRYIFEPSRIQQLKGIVAELSNLPNPSRVQLVSSLIHECTMQTIGSSFSALIQNFNLRGRLKVINETSVGNYFLFFATVGKEIDKNTNLSDLVFKSTKEKEEYSSFVKEIEADCCLDQLTKKEDEYKQLIDIGLRSHKNSSVWVCTSWCNFGFYDINLGFGNPLWVTVPRTFYSYSMILMDSRDGGIEAVIGLPIGHIAGFEQLIKEYAIVT